MALACARPTRKSPDGRTGTVAGHRAHIVAGEQPCQACSDGRNAERRKHPLPGDEAVCARPTHWHPTGRTGTNAGYQAHMRANDPPCDPCREGSLLRSITDESYRNARHKSRMTNRAIIHDAKAAPCADCGGTFPYYVMQFDHRPGTDKRFNVGQNGPTRGQAALLAEIEKCDVVCANCHAVRTHERGHYYEKRARNEAC